MVAMVVVVVVVVVAMVAIVVLEWSVLCTEGCVGGVCKEEGLDLVLFVVGVVGDDVVLSLRGGVCWMMMSSSFSSGVPEVGRSTICCFIESRC